MLKILGCVAQEHDLRLVAISAVICGLGCFTTTTLVARAGECGRRSSKLWLASAAAVFGCSVWSVHFIAMLAFMPGLEMAYDMVPTASSILVASGGASLALFAWRAPGASPARIAGAGVLLGMAVTGMHYVGVAAMSFSGFLLFDHAYVAASVLISIIFSVVALARASDLRTMHRRFEVAGWLALAILRAALHRYDGDHHSARNGGDGWEIGPGHGRTCHDSWKPEPRDPPRQLGRDRSRAASDAACPGLPPLTPAQ